MRSSAGLGDTVENVLTFLGVHQLIQYVAIKLKVSCGCERRRRFLNYHWRYRKSIMELEEYEYLKTYFAREGSKMPKNNTEARHLYGIYVDITGQKYRKPPCLCGSSGARWGQIIETLKTEYAKGTTEVGPTDAGRDHEAE